MQYIKRPWLLVDYLVLPDGSQQAANVHGREHFKPSLASQVIDLLYANSGWHFNEVEKAMLGGVGMLMQKHNRVSGNPSETSPKWFQQEYNWVGFVAVSDPGPGTESLIKRRAQTPITVVYP